MPPGLFGSTAIDCSACMEKANTRGTVGATEVVVALEPVSKMAADITDDRALGGDLRLAACPLRVKLRRCGMSALSLLHRQKQTLVQTYVSQAGLEFKNPAGLPMGDGGLCG